MAWYAFDVIEPAIDKTKAFFTGPDARSKWIKIGILMFIFTLLSAGGSGVGNFSNLNTSDSDSFANAIKTIGQGSTSESTNAIIGSASELPELPNMTGFASLMPSLTPDLINTIIIVAIILLIVLFIIGILLTILKNMAFFAIIESTETNEVHIREYMKKFWSKAISVTKFEIVVGVISLICIVILLLALLMLVASFFTGLIGSASNLFSGIAAFGIILIPLAILALLVMIVLIIVGYIFGQFAMYWMYFSEMKAFEAFKKSISLVKNNIAQVIVLLLVQFGLGIIAAIIGLVALFVVAIPFVIVAVIVAIILIMIVSASASLLLAMIAIGVLLLIIGLMFYVLCLNIALAPVKLFFFNYNILFLQALLKQNQTTK
ncbi:MAG: hypothetical protein V1672_04165 [Candidatus Diapherotrites archaeon]